MCKIVWKELTPPSVSQLQLSEQLLGQALGDDFRGNTKSWLSQFFTGKKKMICQKYALFFLANGVDHANSQPYAYGTFPLWLRMRQAWQQLLDQLEQSNCAVFRRQIQELLRRMVSCSSADIGPLIAGIADALEPEDFTSRLASLGMIACTWYIWENSLSDPVCANQAARLADLLLPPSANLFVSAESDRQSQPEAVLQADQASAQILLQQARALVQKGQYGEAGDVCEKIVFCHTFAPDVVLGEAYYLLGCCCEPDLGGHTIPMPFSSVGELFQKATSCGYDYATTSDHAILQQPVRACDSRPGVCVYSAENALSRLLLTTMPETWHAQFSDQPYTILVAGRRQRFVLLDDCLEKNVGDGLELLSAIQNSAQPLEAWRETEIFLRCEEEQASPLLDTALSFLRSSHTGENCPVRIFLLDEAKRAAQRLFAFHPLFYPLTLDPDSAAQRTLHLVVLSSSPSLSLASWLVREAFWLLPIPQCTVNTRITVLSPHASDIRAHIEAICPGLVGYMESARKKSESGALQIDDIPFAKLEFIDTNFGSASLSSQLQKIEASKDLLYYVIDAPNDMETLALGIRVREQNIRQAVLTNRIGQYSRSRAVVALHCTDPHCVQLVRDLLVPKEIEHGNQWFNNYGFVVFGSADQIYSWDELDGGVLERAAQCIHLQYCGAAPRPADHPELKSYFERLYNRDSSFCCAVSLPYRLFRVGVTAFAWYIQNPAAYWGVAQRRQLAAQFRDKLLLADGSPDPVLLEQLARYEHTRWCCYMLSRGWLPTAYPDQAVQIIRAGAPRHMLQIAKLHPCICSWKGLQELHAALAWAGEGQNSDSRDERFAKYRDDEGLHDYFTKIDLQNIIMTPELLCVSWLPENTKEEKIR